MKDNLEKHRRCKHYVMGTLEEVKQGRGHYCAPNAETLGEAWEQRQEIDPAGCESCEKFKSLYIEFPITITGISHGDIEPWDIGLMPVKIRPCSEGKTYFGIYLGRFPREFHITFSEKTGELKVGTTTNPCIYVPEKKDVCWGDESWWSRIEPGESITDITDETIRGQWYVQMLENLVTGDKTTEEEP